MTIGRKICMAITGAALIALGVICIISPLTTIISLAWAISIGILISGFTTLFNWFSMRRYVHASGSIFFSGLLQILLGILFLRNGFILAAMLPYIFAFYLVFEGVNLAIRSLDYKKVGFNLWWINLALGIIAAFLGFSSLYSPAFGGSTLSTFVGAGFISAGLVYFVALFAVGKFQKMLSSNPWLEEVDEQ